MKTTSILALATALALCAPTFALAQDASATTTAAGSAATTATGTTGAAGSTVGGTAGATAALDANADGTVTVEEQSAFDLAASATATASVNATFKIDADANGTISAAEAVAINTLLTAQTGATFNIDTNADGTISPEELAIANALLAEVDSVSTGSVAGTETFVCGDGGIEATIAGMGDLDMAALAAATKVSIVAVSDCDTAEVSAALATEGATNVQKALEANAAAVAAIQARGASVANVLGATTSGASLTVYVADIQG